MNLSRVNLNLLVALDVLLTERHVTKAGKKLHLSQSAMSNILKQLRDTFKDELFVRGARSSMLPTPRALALAVPVRDALEKAALVFEKPESFEPMTAQQTFTIAMSDYTEFVVLPALVKKLRQVAPNINIIIKHLNYFTNEHIAEFESDKIDLAIGIYLETPPRLNSEVLFEDHAVVVGAKNNPLLKKPLSLKEFAAANHLLVLFFEDRSKTLSEQILNREGLTRRAVVTVSHNLPAIYLLPETDLITLTLQRVVGKFGKALSLAYQPAPFENPIAIVSQVWHSKNDADPAQRWLRNLVKDVAATI